MFFPYLEKQSTNIHARTQTIKSEMMSSYGRNWNEKFKRTRIKPERIEGNREQERESEKTALFALLMFGIQCLRQIHLFMHSFLSLNYSHQKTNCMTTKQSFQSLQLCPFCVLKTFFKAAQKKRHIHTHTLIYTRKTRKISNKKSTATIGAPTPRTHVKHSQRLFDNWIFRFHFGANETQSEKPFHMDDISSGIKLKLEKWIGI